MDKIQRWLKQKEAQKPSPSLEREPASIIDKLKMKAKTLARRVEYMPPKNYDSLSSEERQEEERLKSVYELKMAYAKQKTGPKDESFIRARKEVLDSLRNPQVRWNYGRKENLDEALETMNHLWKASGWNDWQLPKEKLMKIRKKAIVPKIKELVKEAYAALDKEGISKRDLENPIRNIEFLANSAGVKFDTDGLWRKLINQFPERAPYVSLSDALKDHPEYQVVHGIPADSTKGSLNNNLVIDRTNNPTWKDFLAYVLDEKPTLACSSLTQQDAPSAMYSRFGIIVENGRVYNAFPEDGISVTYSPEVKLPGIQGSGELKQRVSNALTNRKGQYNELIVGKPEIKGLYFSDGISRLGKNTTNRDKFLGTEEENNVAVRDLARIALERGLPLYSHSHGRGFEEVDPRSYIQEEMTVAA